MKRTIILIFILLCGTLASAQEFCDSARISFRQGRWDITSVTEPTRAALDSVLFPLTRARTDTTVRLHRVIITGSASPEGSQALNRRLSERRAASLHNYISTHASTAEAHYEYRYTGRNWSALLLLARADDALPHRNEALALIEEAALHPSPDGNETQLRALQRLAGGSTYSYMLRTLFPALRYSELLVCYELLSNTVTPSPEAEPLTPVTTVPSIEPTASPDSLLTPTELPRHHAETIITEEATYCRPFYMGLKTNLLYDAAAVPTLGAEIYIGKQWSLTVDGMYAWWSKKTKNRFWRIYGAEVGARRWFGRKAAEKPLTGHHLGLYAQALTYDFMWGKRGYMGGEPEGNLFDRATVGGGIEYGYALPVGRRLNIDFAVGAGFLTGRYYEYLPIDDCYVWQCTKNRRYFGPTRAQVALVWLLGCDNYNRRKGGRR
jgi:hypothetical protein